MNDYRLLACDIDGTLLNKEKTISPATVRAFEKLIKKDVHIALISARMPKGIRYLQEALSIADRPLIAYNGSLIFLNGKESDLMSNQGISAETCTKLVGLLDGTGIHPGLYSHDEWCVTQKDWIVEKEVFNTKTEPAIRSASEVLQHWQEEKRMVHKLMLMGPEEEMQVVDERIRELGKQSYKVYRSKEVMYEITSAHTSKEMALRKLAAELGVDMKQVVAIGDNDNDIEMIKAAGCGVAVDNAKKELKEVADMITDKNTEDGVAKAIDQLFL